MARGARGRGRPTPGGRLPTGPTGGALTVFRTPADWWDPSSLGHTGRPSWAQDSAHWADVKADMAIVSRRVEISVGTAYCGHACPWKRVGVDLTVATPRPVPLYEGMGVVGVTGRLPMADFSGSH